MKSQLADEFIPLFRALPEEVRASARRQYQLWKQNPRHPSLHFKTIHPHDALYSVRIGRNWRVLGLLENDTMTWFWIGSHAEYDQFIRKF